MSMYPFPPPLPPPHPFDSRGLRRDFPPPPPRFDPFFREFPPFREPERDP